MNLGLLLLIIIYVILTAIFIFGIVRNIKNNNIDSTLGFTDLWIWLHFVIMVGGTIIAFVFLIKYLWTIPLW